MRCVFCGDYQPLDDLVIPGNCLSCWEYYTDTYIRTPPKLRVLLEEFLSTLNMVGIVT